MTAASIGARLCSYLEKTLPVTKVFLWSDSQIVLQWLHTTKQLKPYVANRITEIKTLTSVDNWKYCPTVENPADLLTRGITANRFVASENWRKGPLWLLASPENWPPWTPSTHLLLTQTEDFTNEGKVPITPEDNQKQPGLHHVIQASNFSSPSRLVNITAYLLRFLKNSGSKNVNQTGPLTLTEKEEVT